jgi:hypothetical protein
MSKKDGKRDDKMIHLSKDIYDSPCKYRGLEIKWINERYASCKMNDLWYFLLWSDDTWSFIM